MSVCESLLNFHAVLINLGSRINSMPTFAFEIMVLPLHRNETSSWPSGEAEINLGKRKANFF